MGTTHFSGLSVNGVPVLGGNSHYIGPLSRVFIVCSNATKFAYLQKLYPTDPDGIPRVYLQNGTNNGINSAIANCRNGYGDTIMIEPGYYLVTTQIVLDKDHVNIIARGDARIQTVLFGGTAAWGAWTSDLLKITGGYYHIAGLGLYTYSDTNSAILLDDAGADGGGDDGGFGQIINCTFSPEGGGVDSELFGIDIKGANNVDIIGCEFIGQKQGGIRFRSGVGNPINPRVIDCKFTGCVSGIELASAVFNGIMQDCWVGTSAYPTGMSMTNGILDGGTGEWSIINCTGSVTALNFVGGAEASTIIGDTSGGYTQLT